MVLFGNNLKYVFVVNCKIFDGVKGVFVYFFEKIVVGRVNDDDMGIFIFGVNFEERFDCCD